MKFHKRKQETDLACHRQLRQAAQLTVSIHKTPCFLQTQHKDYQAVCSPAADAGNPTHTKERGPNAKQS